MRPADLQLGLQVSKHETGVLEIEDRFAKCLALAHKLHRLVKAALGRRLRADGDRKALLRQLGHKVDEAHAFLTKAVGDRNAYVFEEKL